jgi:hypothetical protein
MQHPALVVVDLYTSHCRQGYGQLSVSRNVWLLVQELKGSVRIKFSLGSDRRPSHNMVDSCHSHILSPLS